MNRCTAMMLAMMLMLSLTACGSIPSPTRPAQDTVAETEITAPYPDGESYDESSSPLLSFDGQDAIKVQNYTDKANAYIGKTVYDESDVVMVFRGVSDTNTGGKEITFTVTNNHNRAIVVGNHSIYINGFHLPYTMKNGAVAWKQTADIKLDIPYDVLTLLQIDGIHSIETSFTFSSSGREYEPFAETGYMTIGKQPSVQDLLDSAENIPMYSSNGVNLAIEPFGDSKDTIVIFGINENNYDVRAKIEDVEIGGELYGNGTLKVFTEQAATLHAERGEVKLLQFTESDLEALGVMSINEIDTIFLNIAIQSLVSDSETNYIMLAITNDELFYDKEG